MIQPTWHLDRAANVPGATGDRVRGFPIGLRGARCTIERSCPANVPGVTGDSVRSLSLGCLVRRYSKLA